MCWSPMNGYVVYVEFKDFQDFVFCGTAPANRDPRQAMMRNV